MLTFNFSIKDSQIEGAGKGLFTTDFVPRKKILAFPNQKHTLYTQEQLDQMPDDSIHKVSAIRWFEDIYSSDIEWSEESHFNHSFTPNCLWHFGMIFALRDIEPGEELTLNYEWLLDEATVLDYIDSQTGQEIRGIKYDEKVRRTSQLLHGLFYE